MMKKHVFWAFISILVIALAGCVTVQDVQRATDLIRTDNELTRLLVEVRPDDRAGAVAYLTGLASDAEGQADALVAAQGNKADAIAFYRIASTAYWKSGSPEVVNALFQTAEKGSALCVEMGENAPDRDCLFLRLVIPFAGLEAVAENNLSGMLEWVDFNDGNATDDEKKTMKDIYGWLKLGKAPTQKILAIGSDDRLLTHASMRDYYCRNAQSAKDYYDSTVSVFVTKIREYGENFGDPKPALDVNLEEARALKLNETVPEICSE